MELAALDFPVVSAASDSDGTITLSWNPVEGAVEYQIFEYDEKTDLLSMLDRTDETNIIIMYSEDITPHRYIVQPVSYMETADNVSPENSVAVPSGRAQKADALLELSAADTGEDTAEIESNAPEPIGITAPIIAGCVAFAAIACVLGVSLMIQKRRRD